MHVAHVAAAKNTKNAAVNDNQSNGIFPMPGRGEKMQELIAAVSFVMAVVGGLAAMFLKERDKQTMGAIVAGAFLISFFINVHQEDFMILRIACMVAFAMAITGGMATLFINDEGRRGSALVTGIVSLLTTFLILFMYLDYSPFY